MLAQQRVRLLDSDAVYTVQVVASREDLGRVESAEGLPSAALATRTAIRRNSVSVQPVKLKLLTAPKRDRSMDMQSPLPSRR